ncbi:hypothetical protein [Amaricoccus sp.]|uniref:hypothetical protein n=1 Tax=Amaricoccus sp. TaxID=1872485 RepID=UPI001B6DD646|nr:hypothetical protein [Amaricoccus sp.]MBP7001572.1 hypothetical protein [Amaricoccus sp.]
MIFTIYIQNISKYICAQVPGTGRHARNFLYSVILHPMDVDMPGPVDPAGQTEQIKRVRYHFELAPSLSEPLRVEQADMRMSTCGSRREAGGRRWSMARPSCGELARR